VWVATRIAAEALVPMPLFRSAMAKPGQGPSLNYRFVADVVVQLAFHSGTHALDNLLNRRYHSKAVELVSDAEKG
jgi:hypothetical protein